jgi:septum formation protein
MVKITLASQSPQRIALLKQIGLVFDVMPSNVNEENVPKTRPAIYVKTLAKLKAKAVAKQVDGGIVIGADTIVCMDGQIIGKPKDRNDAAETLKRFDGKVHEVVTGICVINKDSGETITTAVRTKVKFRRLDDRLIEWYLSTDEALDKAGSYAIQGRGAVLIEWIRGEYSNVVGLPLTKLVTTLEKMNVL